MTICQKKTRSRMETEVAKCIRKVSFLMAGYGIERRGLAQLTRSLTTELRADLQDCVCRWKADLLGF